MTRELVERAMRGDHEAFGSLAEASVDRLSGTAGLILRDSDAADEAVQEALVRAWRDLPGLRDPDRFEAWLYRIVVRACHDQLRRRRREPANQHQGRPESATAADEIGGVADRDELAAALGGLSDSQRAPDELDAARQVVESIRGQAYGSGIRIVFTPPRGWDTG